MESNINQEIIEYQYCNPQDGPTGLYVPLPVVNCQEGPTGLSSDYYQPHIDYATWISR